MLAVGDSTDLEIIFSTKVYSSRVTKAPKIMTNEGKAPKSVRITATVVARPDSTYPLVMKPYKIDVSQFGEQSRDQVKMTITNVSDQPQVITMVDYPADLFEIKLPEKLLPGASGEAVLTLTDAGKEAGFEKSFTLEVDDSQTTRFTVPVERKLRNTGEAAAK